MAEIREWEELKEAGRDSGKLTVRETRHVIAVVDGLESELERLRQKLVSLTGETVTVREVDLVGTGYKVQEYPGKGDNGQWVSDLDDDVILRAFGGRVKRHREMERVWYVGSEANVWRFLKLRRAINEVLLSAYNEGLQAGSSMLEGLASGSVAIGQYDDVVTARAKRMQRGG